MDRYFCVSVWHIHPDVGRIHLCDVHSRWRRLASPNYILSGTRHAVAGAAAKLPAFQLWGARSWKSHACGKNHTVREPSARAGLLHVQCVVCISGSDAQVCASPSFSAGSGWWCGGPGWGDCGCGYGRSGACGCGVSVRFLYEETHADADATYHRVQS